MAFVLAIIKINESINIIPNSQRINLF